MADFKKCRCGKIWKTRDDFLKDPKVDLFGYLARLEDSPEGSFLFIHLETLCATTLMTRVSWFEDLYRGERFPESAFGTPTCEKRCVNILDLHSCKASCANAYVREVIQIIKAIEKDED